MRSTASSIEELREALANCPQPDAELEARYGAVCQNTWFQAMKEAGVWGYANGKYWYDEAKTENDSQIWLIVREIWRDRLAQTLIGTL